MLSRTAIFMSANTSLATVGAAPAGLADLRLQARGRQQQADLEIGRRLRRGLAQRQRRPDQGGARESCRAEPAAG